MSIRTQLRTLATASLLSLTILAAPAGLAHAEKNWEHDWERAKCLGRGYVWDEILGVCADKPCSGLFGDGKPGDTIIIGSTTYYCDGYTGKWVAISAHPPKPTGPAAPGRASTASQ